MVASFNRQMKHDESLRNRVEKRFQIVSEFNCPEFQSIVTRTRETLKAAVYANMGMWFFYIVPIVVAAACMDSIKSFVSKVASVPEGELGKVVPFGAVAA
jgi:hypothetical protein